MGQNMVKGGYAMKKLFALALVIISALVLTLSPYSWHTMKFSRSVEAAEKVMNKDTIIKQGDIMLGKGQMMMDQDKMIGEGMMK